MLFTLSTVVIINLFVLELLLYDKITIVEQVIGINKGDVLNSDNTSVVCISQNYCLQQMCLLKQSNVSVITLIPTTPTVDYNCNVTSKNNFYTIYHDMRNIIITHVTLNIIAMVLIGLAAIARCCKHEDTYVVLILLTIPIFLISVFMIIVVIVENLITLTNYKFIQNVIMLTFYLLLQFLCLLNCINNFTTIKYVKNNDLDELLSTTI